MTTALSSQNSTPSDLISDSVPDQVSLNSKEIGEQCESNHNYDATTVANSYDLKRGEDTNTIRQNLGDSNSNSDADLNSNSDVDLNSGSDSGSGSDSDSSTADDPDVSKRSKNLQTLKNSQTVKSLKSGSKSSQPVTPLQFKIFRFVFGIYLVWHFYSLTDFAIELFSNEGMIPYPDSNPTWSTWIKHVPSNLIPINAVHINGFLNIMIVSAFFFALGMSQILNSLIVWYGWAFFFNRNNFIANPGLPYVGWLLLACAIIPNPGPLLVWPFISLQELQHINDFRAWTFSKSKKTPSCQYHKKEKHNEDEDIDDKIKATTTSTDNRVKMYNTLQPTDSDWNMPPLVFWGAWFLMAFGYTVSGIHKLQCESWVDGSALLHVLESLLARDNQLVKLLIELMDSNPLIMKFLTWSSLFLEISFLPLGIFDRLRFSYWISFLAMHIGIMCLIDFTDLTLGVLMIHLFTFDKRWLR